MWKYNRRLSTLKGNDKSKKFKELEKIEPMNYISYVTNYLHRYSYERDKD